MKRKALTEVEVPPSEGEGRRSPRVLDLASEAAFDAIIITDRSGRILEAGGTFEEVFGSPAIESAGRAIDELMLPRRPREETKTAPGRPVAVDGFPRAGRSLELTARHASGRHFPVKANVRDLEAGGERGFVICVRDASRLEEAKARRQQAEKELEEVRAELRALALKVPLDVESERRRIARGLHDQVGNALAIAKMRVVEMRRSATENSAVETLEDIERLTANAMQEIRSLTFELSSPVLYELGLEAALKSLGRRLAERHDIVFHFSSDDRDKPLSQNRQVILYRIIEELLANVVKHAWASNARISVDRNDDAIRITVEDDGVGVESLERALPGPDGGFGLYGVRQRLEHIDGGFEIEAAFPSGTRAVVTAPLELDSD